MIKKPTALIFCDVETTGLDPNDCAVLSIGLVAILGNDSRYRRAEFKVKPHLDCKVEEKAMEINGMSLFDCINNHDESDYIAEIISNSLRDFRKKYNLIFVAHHAKFDWAFLDAFFQRHSIYTLDDFFSAKICTKVLAQAVYQDLPSYSLGNLSKDFRLEYDPKKHHGALYDANLCMQLFYHLTEKKPCLATI